MNKKFNGDYLYMLHNTSDYHPLPVWVSTDLNEAIKVLKINKNTERGLTIWINERLESKIVHFNGSYYQLMMDFIDDVVIPRDLVKEIRSILNPYVEKELEEYERKEEEKRKDQEKMDLQELYRLAEKYGKTIID